MPNKVFKESLPDFSCYHSKSEQSRDRLLKKFMDMF